MTGDNAALVAEYFRCLNEEDWAGMRAIWASDGTLRAVGARPRNGIDDVLAYFPRIFGAWVEHRDSPVRIIDAGAVVTVEVRFTGRTLDGVDAEFDAVDVFDVADSRIARLSNWYDLTAARSALSGQT